MLDICEMTEFLPDYIPTFSPSPGVYAR